MVGKWTRELEEFLDFRNKVLKVILELGTSFGEVVESSKVSEI